MQSMPEDAADIPEETVRFLWQEYERVQKPVIVEKERSCYMVFGLQENLVILGPAYLYGISAGNPPADLPCLLPEKAAACLSTICYLMTENYISEKELLQSQPDSTQLWEQNAVKKFMLFSEEDGERYGYDTEEAWLAAIERGELAHQDADMKRTYQELYRVGVLTEQGEQKQAEYMMVSAITLASRASIRGGADPHLAYELSDLYMQKLSAAPGLLAAMQVGMDAVNAFNDLVKKHLEQANRNIYCEQVKNYIGRHIREKIRISDIAAYVGLNSSYLTHLFTESEGMPIKTYIMQERLKLAANLLKNTNETVGMISDYLHFNSQSYFTSCFRKAYGMMPTEYRQKNKNFSRSTIKYDN